jgi:hypothetical protein
MPLPPLLFPFCVSRPPTPPPFPTRPHVLFVVMLLRLPQLLLPRCCCRRCCCRRLTHVSIETVLTRAACVYAWFCMRVPTQPAPATRTTTDPWGSGSTVVISQVRDSDGFDLKGMGLCLSLCMRIVRACLLACLLTAQSLHSWLHGQINQRIPYVGPEPVLSGQIHQRLVSACPEPVCSAVCSLASAVLDLPALQSAAIWGSSFASIDSYR